MPIHIHALMKNPYNNHGITFQPIEYEMLTHGEAVLSRSDIVAISADSGVFRNQVKGPVQPQ